MNFSLVIPAYNEELRISKTLTSYIDFFEIKKIEYEIIVVIDGTDNTEKIVKSFNNPKLVTLIFNKRLGKGGAVIEGFKVSKYDIIGFVDADSSITPYNYQKLFTYTKQYDCVIAVRTIRNRKLLSNGFNIIANILFDIGVSDTQCGAKIFSKSLLNKIIPIMRLNGFEFDVELLWLVKTHRYKIKTVDIEWQSINNSKFNFKYIPMMFFNIIKRKFLSCHHQ